MKLSFGASDCDDRTNRQIISPANQQNSHFKHNNKIKSKNKISGVGKKHTKMCNLAKPIARNVVCCVLFFFRLYVCERGSLRPALHTVGSKMFANASSKDHCYTFQNNLHFVQPVHKSTVQKLFRIVSRNTKMQILI